MYVDQLNGATYFKLFYAGNGHKKQNSLDVISIKWIMFNMKIYTSRTFYLKHTVHSSPRQWAGENKWQHEV